MSRCAARILFTAAALTALAGCGGGGHEDGGRTDLLLVTVEQWWHDPAGTDPFAPLDEQGFTRITDAMTPCPQTLPAVAALMTGSGPDRLGVRQDRHTTLPEDAPLLAERLAAAGWRTAAFSATPSLGRDSGLDRGFEIFESPPPFVMYGPEGRFPPIRQSEPLVRDALTWLDSTGDAPGAFVWLHLSGPAWVPPEGERANRDLPSPRPGLAALLAGLRERGRLESTEIWVVGTSGPLDESAEGSGYVLNPVVLRVPLLHHPAADREPVAAGAAVWTPDVAAALLSAAGLPDGLGEALAPGAREVRAAWTWSAALEMGWWPAVGAVADGLLLVSAEGPGSSEVWDWAAGRPSDAAVPQALAAALEARRGDAAGLRVSPVREIPAELREALAAVALSAPEHAGRPDDTARESRWQSLAEMLRARRLAAARGRAPALAAYRNALSFDPSNRAAALELGQMLSINRPAKARPRLEQARDLDPFEPEVWHGFGHLAFTEQQYRAADAALRLSAYLRPASADLLYDLACSTSRLGNLEESIAYLERAWQAGFRDVDHVQNDPDLRNLREDPRYAAFMSRVVQ